MNTREKIVALLSLLAAFGAAYLAGTLVGHLSGPLAARAVGATAYTCESHGLTGVRPIILPTSYNPPQPARPRPIASP